MQYVLSQKEMDEQCKKLAALEQLPTVEALQNFCTFVANNLILTSGWASGRAWGCILTKGGENYCDECPARLVCPHPFKSWSK